MPAVFSLTEQVDRDFIEKSLQDSEKVQVQTNIGLADLIRKFPQVATYLL
jgi:hypothetical protein